MQPTPDYFIVRPATKDGMPGPIVPLIAVDQLPAWMQLVGVPCELDAEQTVGLTNLGLVALEEDSTFDVRLHSDKIRANLGFADDATNSYSPGNGNAKAKATEDKRTATLCETKVKTNEEVGSSDLLAILPGDSNNAGSNVADKTSRHGHSSGRMLSASCHNIADSFQASSSKSSKEKPLRPHMTKATLEESRPIYPKRAVAKQDKQPATAFCRHWCFHGTCKWGLQCRYVHRMPSTVEGLRGVGLKGLPNWYLLMMSDAGSDLPGLSSIDNMLRRLEDVQLSAQQHTATQQPQPLIQHYVPDQRSVDPGLIQGHLSALLALDHPVSTKQKLKQIREMRHLLLYGMHPPQGQGQPVRQNNNDYTNVRAAVNAPNIRRRAGLHQQIRDNTPVVTPVRTRARSTVEGGRDGGGDDGGGDLPGKEGGRASNDCDDVTNVRSAGFVTGRAGFGEEKLVDID